MDFKILVTEPSKDYELLDAGEGEKLERYGSIIVRRPDPQALWKKSQPHDVWDKAQAVFLPENNQDQTKKTSWTLTKEVPERWQIELGGLQLWIKPSAFKHIGVFPEQVSNWSWIEDTIKKFGKTPHILNIFGYTGGATLAAARAGGDVVHLDGSKSAVTWAKENAELSDLADKPIRWIVDDARTFLKREVKRGNKYDGIIMDPPAFGRGPNGEVWKIEDNFLELIDLARQVLTDSPLFFLINGYASGYSALAYKHILETLLKPWKGELEMGELTIRASTSGVLLPAGIFSRWRKS